jgi:capsular exopolysaccharide synthesis family protein
MLTCGAGLSNPAEILNSPRFAKLLQSLSEVYDRILVDAPPVTIVTDAQILGARCDFTILVLKADKSTRKMAQRAIDALQSVGAHLLGVVVNEVHKSGGRYGYYGGYGEYYGSRSPGNGSAKKRESKTRAAGQPVAASRVGGET